MIGIWTVVRHMTYLAGLFYSAGVQYPGTSTVLQYSIFFALCIIRHTVRIVWYQ